MDQNGSPAHQHACYRCGVLRVFAQQPCVVTSRGWMCGYCVEQLAALVGYSKAMHDAEVAAAAAIASRPQAPESYPTVQQEQPQPTADWQQRLKFGQGQAWSLGPREAAIYRALAHRPLTRAELQACTGMPDATVRRCVGLLLRRGMICEHGSGEKGAPFTYGYPQPGP